MHSLGACARTNSLVTMNSMMEMESNRMMVTRRRRVFGGDKDGGVGDSDNDGG